MKLVSNFVTFIQEIYLLYDDYRKIISKYPDGKLTTGTSNGTIFGKKLLVKPTYISDEE